MMALDAARGGRRKRRLAALMAVALAGTTSVEPAVIEVSNGCTLVRAILSANGDDDQGGLCPPGGSGPDTLVLTDDVVLFGVNNAAYDADNGLPLVASEITIDGAGFTIERSETAPAFRIFAVAAGGSLTLKDVTLRGGESTGHGGGIASYGTLNVDGSFIEDNAARSGGGITSSGVTTITNSTVSGNRAAIVGGGIYNRQQLTIEHSTISNNFGDGLTTEPYGYSSNVVILQSTISGNTGHGIRHYDDLRMTGGEVSNNGRKGALVGTIARGTFTEVTFEGNGERGVHVGFYGDGTVDRCTLTRNAGGGMYTDAKSTFVIRNSTISGNVAESIGAALLIEGRGELLSSTVVANTSTLSSGAAIAIPYSYSYPGLRIRYHIIAGNEPANFWVEDKGTRGVGTTCFGLPEMVLGVDVSAELADNGGPTRTHALLPGSSAIDRAGNCLTDVDQRGAPRVPNACDCGAYEYLAPVVCEVCSDTELLIGRISELRVDSGCSRSECATLPPELDPLEYLLTLPPTGPGDGYFYLD